VNDLIGRIKTGWDLFWFQPEPAQALGVCRILFFGMLLQEYGREDFTLCAALGQFYWRPLSLFHLFFAQGPPSIACVAWAQVIWKISLATALLGLFTRLSTGIACALGLFLMSFPHNFGMLNHQMAASGVALIVMAMSQCGRVWSLDRLLARMRGKIPAPLSGAEARWPIQTMRVVISLVLFCAGFNKLRISGLDWVFSETMQMNLLQRGTALGHWFAQWPLVCQFMAASGVVIEFFHPLSLLSKRLALIWVPAGLLLFTGINQTMDISFKFLIFLHIFWLPWNRIFLTRRGRLD
jgi:hypothetical protein